MELPEANSSAVRVRGGLLAALAVAFQVGLGWLDYESGPRWGFSFFYLIPVVAVGWWVGRGPALFTAVAGSIAWYLADRVWYPDVAPSLWNASSRAVIFVGTALLVSAFRVQRDELRHMLVEQQALARVDGLTGLVNPRGFEEILDTVVEQCRAQGTQLGLVFVDLDNFKSVNDIYGHAEGDEVLRRVAEAIRAVSRQKDLVARMGGDELVLLCPGASEDALRAVGQRVVAAVEKVGSTVPEASLGASIGSVHLGDGESGRDLMARADQEMYAAKRARKARAAVKQEVKEAR